MTSPVDRPRLADATVLLIGTGDHTGRSDLPRIRAASTTVEDLRFALINHSGVNPDRITTLEPSTQTEFGDAVRTLAGADTGVLLFYFVGHGLVNAQGALHLAARESQLGRDYTSLAYDSVRTDLRDSRAGVRLVVLDCCFAGRAVDVLAADDDPAPLVDIEGVCVLTSSGRNEFARAPDSERHTVFTGALIRLLTEGDPGLPDQVTLGAAVTVLHRRMRAVNHPAPRYLRTGRIDDLVLADNAARADAPRTVRQGPPVRRFRGGRLTAFVGAALAGPGVAALADGAFARIPDGARGWLVAPTWRWVLFVLVIAFLARTLARWITVGVGTRVAAWVTRAGRPWRPEGLHRWPPVRRAIGRLMRPTPRVLSWRRGLSLAVPLLLAFGLGAGTLQVVGAGRVAVAGCAPAAQFSVLTTPDSLDPVQRLVDGFLAADRRDFGCPLAQVHLAAMPAAQALGLLRVGWTDEARRAAGPRPDLWLPESSVYTSQLGDGAHVGPRRSVAVSPIVLATPDRALSTTVAAEHLPPTGEGMRDLVDGAARAGRTLVLPAPTGSAAGVLARAALYLDSAPGYPAGFEERLDRDRGTVRLPAEADVATLLCRYDELRPPVALLVPEQAAVRFNRGDPIGPACAADGDRSDTRLRLSYPDRTAVLDFPLVRMRWNDRAPARRAAAERFDGWLGSADGARALAGVGLRPPGFAGGGALTTDAGARPGAPFTVLPTDAALRRRIDEAYAAAQRPGRVMLALDASGSMGGPAGDPRWAAAARAAVAGVASMGAGDELGVSVFQGSGVRRLVPVGPRVPGLDATVGGALSGVRPAGSTPLFDAVRDGAQAVRAPARDLVSAVVVLTDGEDDNASALSADGYAAEIGATGVQVWVVAVGEAQCTATILRRLVAATGGGCVRAGAGGADDAGAALTTVLRAVWRG